MAISLAISWNRVTSIFGAAAACVGVLAAGCNVAAEAEVIPLSPPVPFQVVASVLPIADPAADQPINGVVQIRFSDFPDPATVSYPTLQIGPRGQTVQFSVEISLVDRQLTLRPRSHFLPATDYFVHIEPQLRSLAGQPLDPGFDLSFHTGLQQLPPDPPSAQVLFADLVADTGPLQKSCALGGCHSSAMGLPARGLDLAADPMLARQQLLSAARVGTERLLLVEPAAPERSYLLRKLLASHGFTRTDGEPMPPPPREPLTDTALRSVEDWIRQGAN